MLRLLCRVCFAAACADAVAAGPQPGDAAGLPERGEELDFDAWQALQLPMALCTACAACGAGVRTCVLLLLICCADVSSYQCAPQVDVLLRASLQYRKGEHCILPKQVLSGWCCSLYR